MSLDDEIDLLCEIFRWAPDDDINRYHALRILRKARDEVIETWDDYKAKVER